MPRKYVRKHLDLVQQQGVTFTMLMHTLEGQTGQLDYYDLGEVVDVIAELYNNNEQMRGGKVEVICNEFIIATYNIPY